jgi:hypothetical protein
MVGNSVRQSRADNPTGLYGVGNAYWQRYGIPLMLTETSVEGQPINREIWLETCVKKACQCWAWSGGRCSTRSTGMAP